MTDEQILENEIKCIARRNECLCNGGSDCVKCDLLMESEEILKCYNRAIRNIDLINRLTAENERLKNAYIQCAWERDSFSDELSGEILNVKRLEKELDTEKNHNERLYKKIDRLVEGAYNIKKIKAEAVKEFVERLVEGRPENNPVVIAIKCELKEMVGESTTEDSSVTQETRKSKWEIDCDGYYPYCPNWIFVFLELPRNPR